MYFQNVLHISFSPCSWFPCRWGMFLSQLCAAYRRLALNHAHPEPAWASPLSSFPPKAVGPGPASPPLITLLHMGAWCQLSPVKLRLKQSLVPRKTCKTIYPNNESFPPSSPSLFTWKRNIYIISMLFKNISSINHSICWLILLPHFQYKPLKQNPRGCISALISQ